MVASRLEIEYWDTSNWIPFTTGGNSLTLSLEIDEKLYQPTVMRFKVADLKDNGPFAASSTNSVLKEFMPIRAVEPNTHIVYFHGFIYRLSNKYEAPYGEVIEGVCYDGVFNFANEFLDSDVDSVTSSTSSGLISTWMGNHILPALITNANDGGDVPRFETSGVNRDVTSKPVKEGRSQTNLLTALIKEATQDKRSSVLDQGYVFYSDPNFTDTATSHRPAQFLTYFPRNRMPAVQGTTIDAAPATNGLTIEKPDGTSISATGQKHIMMSAVDLSSSNREQITDIIATYTHDETGEKVSKRFSIIHYTAVAGLLSGQYDGIAFDATVGTGISNISNLTDSSDTVIGRIQYMSKASGSGFMILSDRSSHDLVAGETLYADNNASGFSITLASNAALGDQNVYEPKAVWEITKTIKLSFGSEVDHNAIRTKLASVFYGGENVPQRASFNTWELPYYTAEGRATVGTGTNALVDSAVDWEAKGLRTGAALVKLDGTGGAEASYGYVSGLTTGGTITAALASGTWASGDYYNWYVRVRAGHSVRLICVPKGIAGDDHVVTRLRIQQNLGSQTITSYETQGLSNPSVSYAELGSPIHETDAVPGKNTIPLGKIAAKFSPNVTPAFKAGDAYLGPAINTMHQYISWGAGTLRIDGQLNIDGTEKTEYAIGTGNSGALTPGIEYVMYFEPASSETQFQIQPSSTYTSKDRTRAKIGTVVPVTASVGAATGEGNEAEIQWDMNDGTITMEGGNSQKLGGDYIAIDGILAKHMLAVGSDATSGVRFKFNTPQGDTAGTSSWFRGYTASSTLDTNGKWFEFDVANKNLNFYEGSINNYLRARFSATDLSFYNGLNTGYKMSMFDGSGIHIYDNTAGQVELVSLLPTGLEIHDYATDQFGAGAAIKLYSESTLIAQIYTYEAGDGSIDELHLTTEQRLGTPTFKAYSLVLGPSSAADYGYVKPKHNGLTYLGDPDHSGTTAKLWKQIGVREGIYIDSVNPTAPSFGGSTTAYMLENRAGTLYFNNAVMAGSGTVTSVTAGTGLTLSSGSSTVNPTLSLAATSSTLHTATLSSGSVPTSSYGTFRYDTDGGGGTADVLAFASGQQSATPAAATGESAFWTMLSENDGASGSRLIFEPIVDAAFSEGADNYAYIGWHNPIFATYTYYYNAAYDSAAFPSFTFWLDNDTGMYHPATNTLGFSTGGAARWSIDSNGDLLPALDGSGGTGYMIGNSSFDIEKLYAYTIFISNLTGASGTSLIVTGSGQILPQVSSIEYKENVEDLVFDSSKLDDLRPVSFNYKSDDVRDVGLIAEEVNEIYPELVNYDKEDKPYSVKYNGLSVMLLDEVKKLRARVQQLEEKN